MFYFLQNGLIHIIGKMADGGQPWFINIIINSPVMQKEFKEEVSKCVLIKQ